MLLCGERRWEYITMNAELHLSGLQLCILASLWLCNWLIACLTWERVGRIQELFIQLERDSYQRKVINITRRKGK